MMFQKTSGTSNFIKAYQGFLIDHHDVRLLMTGLAKNISKLESDRSLTFLYRAPKTPTFLTFSSSHCSFL